MYKNLLTQMLSGAFIDIALMYIRINQGKNDYSKYKSLKKRKFVWSRSLNYLTLTKIILSVQKNLNLLYGNIQEQLSLSY